eukprot:CAMPEP_0170612678 /NCGR_PEP_ID=MMETSP0224-20130122/23855_1 /TAXON_ID=285029 /ORGANISM="Togula jolla, Strain CCCM 725" /LENGTH=34 /DNA_ID= /DNA_START= /DNA_END= /DNA_ORIENTATION=
MPRECRLELRWDAHSSSDLASKLLLRAREKDTAE